MLLDDLGDNPSGIVPDADVALVDTGGLARETLLELGEEGMGPLGVAAEAGGDGRALRGLERPDV